MIFLIFFGRFGVVIYIVKWICYHFWERGSYRSRSISIGLRIHRDWILLRCGMSSSAKLVGVNETTIRVPCTGACGPPSFERRENRVISAITYTTIPLPRAAARFSQRWCTEKITDTSTYLQTHMLGSHLKRFRNDSRIYAVVFVSNIHYLSAIRLNSHWTQGKKRKFRPGKNSQIV